MNVSLFDEIMIFLKNAHIYLTTSLLIFIQHLNN